MNKYIFSILGISLFVGFVTYATIQTKRQEEQNVLKKESLIPENTEIPNNNLNILPIKPHDQTSKITATKPLIMEKPKVVKKVYNTKYTEEDTGEESDD